MEPIKITDAMKLQQRQQKWRHLKACAAGMVADPGRMRTARLNDICYRKNISAFDEATLNGREAALKYLKAHWKKMTAPAMLRHWSFDPVRTEAIYTAMLAERYHIGLMRERMAS